MKNLFLGLALLVSASTYADISASDFDMENTLASAHLSTNLWYCDSEEALKELSDSLEITNELGCAATIKTAKSTLDVGEISSILNKHITKLKLIEKFEEEVKSGKQYNELVTSVKLLKDKGLSFRKVKRFSNLTDDELFVVEMSFFKARTKLEIALEEL